MILSGVIISEITPFQFRGFFMAILNLAVVAGILY